MIRIIDRILSDPQRVFQEPLIVTVATRDRGLPRCSYRSLTFIPAEGGASLFLWKIMSLHTVKDLRESCTSLGVGGQLISQERYDVKYQWF